MQRYLIIILLVLMGLMLVACEDDAELRILRIRNRTNAPITAKVDEGEEFTIESGSGWSKIYTEDRSVTVSYEGLYVYDKTTVERTVTKGLPTTVTVLADCGAITINNDSDSLVVTEIFISRNDATDWGENLIAGNMTSGASHTWKAPDGQWDVKLTTDTGSLYKMNQTIAIDKTLELNISEFGTHTKKAKATGIGSTESELTPRKVN